MTVPKIYLGYTVYVIQNLVIKRKKPNILTHQEGCFIDYKCGNNTKSVWIMQKCILRKWLLFEVQRFPSASDWNCFSVFARLPYHGNVQASRCLLSLLTFSFLFLLPCFFQGFPACCSPPAFPCACGPLPGL